MTLSAHCANTGLQILNLSDKRESLPVIDRKKAILPDQTPVLL